MFPPEVFLESLNKKLNIFALSDSKPIGPQFNKFKTIFTDAINEHAPLKKLPEEKKDSNKNHGLTQSKRKTDCIRNYQKITMTLP